MDSNKKQPSKISEKETEEVLVYFEKLGYKRMVGDKDKLNELADKFPEKDFVMCAHQMYLWFDEANRRGRKIKSYHQTFRNWVSKDYAPTKKKSEEFLDKYDI